MQRTKWAAPIAAAAILAFTAPAMAAGKVGDDAAPLSPAGWLNGESTLSWGDFEGQVVLIEKWATW